MAPKYKPYKKRRTIAEQYEYLIESRARTQWRLSHQNECFINEVRQEELDLEYINRSILVIEEIYGYGNALNA